MRVVKCKQNHFFDADKYSTCPQCGAPIVSSSGSSKSSAPASTRNSKVISTEKNDSGETFGIFKKKPSKAAKKNESPADRSSESNNYEKLKSFQTNSQSNYIGSDKSSMNSNSLLGESSNDAVPKKMVNVPVVQKSSTSGFVYVSEQMVEQPQDMDDHSADDTQSSEDSLLNEIKKVTADNDGKTVGFFSSNRSSDTADSGKSDDKGSSPAAGPVNAPSDEPVVGWLVCIKGPNAGQYFNVYAGKNSLGRSNNNKIVIAKDKSISRERHAWIIYEPRNREFFAQPGDSSGLTYVNETNIMQATKLERYSHIDIGNTTLLLIPLCCEEFTWEDYL